MGLRRLLLFSLFLLPLSLQADTAADYATRGAEKYVFGQEDAAKKEVAEGLAKFPHDPELQEMVKLFKDKPPNNKQQQQKKDQQNQDQQNQDQKDQQQQSQNGQGNQQNQNQSPTPSPTPGTTPTPTATASPTPTPGESPGTTPTPSPGGESPTPTATPGEEQGQSPTPSPGEGTPTPAPGSEGSPTPTPGEGDQENGEGQKPSPSPGGTPAKPLTGAVKGAGEQQPQASPSPGEEAAELEAEKKGEMSPKQAVRLLESMKDEERKVQLDEHRAVRHVYKDW